MLLISTCGAEIHKEVQAVIKENQTAIRLTEYENDKIYGVYKVTDSKNQQLIQLVKQKGFIDGIKMMVVINCKGDEVENIEILEHRESNDYGGLLTEDWFLERFNEKSIFTPLNVVKMSSKENNQIVAITGVNLCMDNYKRIKEEQ